MRISKVFEKLNIPCIECGAIEDLTRHHLKNRRGKRTGAIKILCRRCHEDAEEEYRLHGITQPHKVSITPNEKLQLDYMNGKVPFYPARQSFTEVEDENGK